MGTVVRCMGTIVPATCKQLYFGMHLVYGGGALGLDGGTRICVLSREGDVGAWVLLCRPNRQAQ